VLVCVCVCVCECVCLCVCISAGSVCLSVYLLMRCVSKIFSAVSGRIFTKFGPKVWTVEKSFVHEFEMERAKVKSKGSNKCLKLALFEEGV